MRETTAAITGAVVGAAAGYLLLSDEGRLVRRRLEPIAIEMFGHAVLFYEAAKRTNELLHQERRDGFVRSTTGPGASPSR
jgi:hypothetical protein